MKNRRKQGKIFRSLLAVLMLTAMLSRVFCSRFSPGIMKLEKQVI